MIMSLSIITKLITGVKLIQFLQKIRCSFIHEQYYIIQFGILT